MIQGERLYLRSLRAEDIEGGYREWLQDPAINQYLEARFSVYNYDQLKDFIQNINASSTDYLFGIFDKDDTYVGNIKIGGINWIHRTAEVGLLIGNRDYWGKGFGSEAIYLVTEYGFNTLNLRKLWAGAYSTNKGSVRAFEKAGYEHECVKKKHFFSNGEYIDDIILCKFNDPIS